VIIAFMPTSSWHAITGYDVGIMILVGIAAGLFFFFWQTGVEKVDSAYAALATAFMPLSTVFLAWIVLGEGLTVTKSIGMLFVILSIVHYARQQKAEG
jgi:drug/metabolite transporter (DMT)-like permease